MYNTGGPAFPAGERFETKEGWRTEDGMTLRDYFAAKAMQGDLTYGVHEDQFAWAAARAYKMADAMLKARE